MPKSKRKSKSKTDITAPESTLNSALVGGSDVVFDLFCEPCNTEDFHLEAVSFCHECHEYLCENCCICHRKSAASRHHILLQRDSLPRTAIAPRIVDILTKTCSKHKLKILEYFCNDHDELCCTVCMVMYHRRCLDILYIPEASDGSDNSPEYKGLATQLERLADKARREQIKINLRSQENDSYLSKTVSNIKACRKQFDKLLDDIEEESVQKLTLLHKENEQMIKSAARKCEAILSDVKAMISDLAEKAQANKTNQLFVDMKLARNRIPSIEAGLKDITPRNISRYEFDQDKSLQEMESTLSSMWSLSFRRDGSDTKARFLREVNVKSEEDTEDCEINGIAVLPGNRVVVTDCKNKAVKLVDVMMNKVTSRLALSSRPFDVIRTQDDQVAVAMSEARKIEIVTVSDVLLKSKTIDIPGKVFQGLCWNGDRLILVYPQACAVKTVDLTGKVLNTIYTDSDSDPLFKAPRYIALSGAQSIVYIADSDAKSVTSMTTRGQIISVYKHESLKRPWTIATGRDGSVYVSCNQTNTVFQLSATGEFVQILLDCQRGLSDCPAALAYSEDNVLYVSNNSSAPERRNFVRLFQLD